MADSGNNSEIGNNKEENNDQEEIMIKEKKTDQEEVMIKEEKTDQEKVMIEKEMTDQEDELEEQMSKEDSGISCNGESSNPVSEYESIIGDIVTEEMAKEEKRLEENAIKEENKLKEQILKEEEKKQLEEQCYKRLNLLLSRSSIYAQFMADKLKRDNLKEAKKQARSEKLKKHSKPESPEQNNKSLKRKTEANCSPQKKQKNEITIIDVFKKESARCEEEKPNVQNNETSNSTSDDSSKTVAVQPSLLSGAVMHPYQIDGFEWLKVLFENGVNGILADEMGLGKTIQTIAFIAYLLEMGVNGPFFVCGPLSTVPNWYLEFQRFAPSIPVMIYHGDKDERKKLRLKINKKVKTKDVCAFPVVITSYQIALIDVKFLCKFDWKLLVVDEAHRIKNFQCRLVTSLKLFNTSHRLLLTGTPLQNNLAELWSLLNFILPEIFDDLKVFESWFDISRLSERGGTKDIVAKEQEKQIVSIIHEILTPFLLRRTKAEVQLKLPPKKEVIVHCPLTKLQKDYYAAALNKTLHDVCGDSKGKHFDIDFDINSDRPKRNIKSNFEDIFKALDDENFDDILEKNAAPIVKENKPVIKASKPDNQDILADIKINDRNISMILRKICGHPYLISYPLFTSGVFRIDEDLVRLSGKLLVLDQLLPEMKKRGHKILLFSQFVTMLEILEDYCIYRNFSYSMLQGCMSLDERDVAIKNFNESPDAFLFLISTKAGGLGINLASADTVIIYDSDWNPQGDLQAQDRCHRIGQVKPVVVYRLIVPNSVDEKIINRAAAKRKLEKVIIKKGRFNGMNSGQVYDKLSVEELIDLLQSSDFNGFVKTDDNNVLSPAEIEAILDRNDMMEAKDEVF